MAGMVDNIPATNILSPSLFLVINWKYLFEKDHHACTGSEKPSNQAGMPTHTAKSIHISSSNNIIGSNPQKATIIVVVKISQIDELGGISSGGESMIK